MKKLALVLVLAFILAPLALAADKTVTFYGSARIMTFVENKDSEYIGGELGTWSDSDTYWDKDASNARFGANFALGDVTGNVEIRPNSGSYYRHWYGAWNFGAGKLIVGQTWTPTFVGLLNSNLAGEQWGFGGLPTAGRAMGLQVHMALGGGNLKIGALAPSTDVTTTGEDLAQRGYTQDTDQGLPRLEVSYDHKISMVEFGFIGGYNSVDTEYHSGVAAVGDTAYSIDSYLLGAWAKIDLKPAYINVGAFMGQNLNNYGSWGVWDDALVPEAYVTSGVTNLADVDYLGYGFDIGFVVNDMFTLDGFYWHTESDYSYSSGSNTYTKETGADLYGVVATIKLADNVFVCPEIAKLDFGDADSTVNGVVTSVKHGTKTIYGIYWQINF